MNLWANQHVKKYCQVIKKSLQKKTNQLTTKKISIKSILKHPEENGITHSSQSLIFMTDQVKFIFIFFQISTIFTECQLYIRNLKWNKKKI